MTELDSISIANAIICEDVRQERSNKFILIGVFSGDVQVEALPAHVSIAVFMDGTIKQAGVLELSIRFSGPGDGEATFKTLLNATVANEACTIAVPRITVLMEQEGVFNIDVSEVGGDWSRVLQKKIILGTLGDVGPRITVVPD